MGFRIPDKVARLVFEGTEYDGAEVRVRLNASLGTFLKIQQAASETRTGDFYDLFAREVLIDWNLEDDAGKPLPVTLKGFRAIPPAFANLLVMKWIDHVAAVPDPLSGPSGAGNTSEAA